MRFKNKKRGGAGTRKLIYKQSKALRHHDRNQKHCYIDSMRHWLAAVFVFSVLTMALVAVFAPRADEILSKLLPALMLILGYYFRSRS